MATNLSIDQDLLNEAVIIGRHSTEKAVVNAALKEYINHRKQQAILSLFNTTGSYDCKSLRSR